MNLRKVAVLNVAFESLLPKFQEAKSAALPLGWHGLESTNGTSFALLRLVDGACCVMPTVQFDTAEELAVHLRALLGNALDDHREERGTWIISENEAKGDKTYAQLVEQTAGEWLPKVAADDPRLVKASGWSFAEAARELGTPKHSSDASGEQTLESATEHFAQVAKEHQNVKQAIEGAFGQVFRDVSLGSPKEGRGKREEGEE